MNKLLFVIDFGTYSSKGVLVETDGTVVKTAEVRSINKSKCIILNISSFLLGRQR